MYDDSPLRMAITPDGRAWRIKITDEVVDEFEKRTGFDLTMRTDDKIRVASHILRFLGYVEEVLCIACDEQLRDRGVTPDDFKILITTNEVALAQIVRATIWALSDYDSQSALGYLAIAKRKED